MKAIRHLILILVVSAGISHQTTAQIEQQRAMNWCWASCIQSVLYQAGTYRSQAEIAATLDGWPRDRPAYISEVVSLLRYFGLRAWSTGRVASPNELYQTLASGWKLIAFVRPNGGRVGHFIVLQGFTPNGLIIVSDPANGMTFYNTLNDLYYGWYWQDAVVVGR